MKAVAAASWFDGERYHDSPVTIVFDGGMIADLLPGEHELGEETIRCACATPGLVDAHCHLFLDGGELDARRRIEYLDAPVEQMMTVARANVARTLERGITLVRDAGDRYGINHAVRNESRRLEVRSAGLALRRPRRYGAFMAREVETIDEARTAVSEIAAAADDLKIIQTGIIDFESGAVKGGPQFDLETLREIVRCAHSFGLRTFAHCSGADGIEVAVNAGVDSIEHGFFINESLLRRMAEQGTAWVPTFSPVHFQAQRPEVAGWNAATARKLAAIVDAHREQVARAAQLGVNLVAGSDAGSPGVEHGAGLIDELFHFLDCGLTLEQTLRAATSRPRQLWNAPAAEIRAGSPVNLALFAGDPFRDPRCLRGPVQALRGNMSGPY